MSIFEALERGKQTKLLGRIRALLSKPRGRSGDILHINSIEILDGRLSDRIPAFKRGNVLICSPQIHAIMVVDLTQRAVVWSMVGSFRFQHHPTVLANGNLLLFDNRRGPNAQSASLELDALSGEKVWAYRGSPDEPFFSRCCGTTYRLPNGNTLIVETEGGRAFEVTPEHDLVWEFVNPHRAGEKDDLIAQLFDLIRLGSEFSLDWLPPASGS